MLENKRQPQLVKTKWGFYRYEPSPSDEELSAHYAQRYYQEAMGSYEISYTDEEVAYFHLKSWLMHKKVVEFLQGGKGTIIDVGCGEGWLLDVFHRHGWKVKGIDFSAYAITKFHPHLLPFFQQGNVYDLLQQEKHAGVAYDVIVLANVIEHVQDPVELLRRLRSMMHARTVLAMVVPNDFSSLQLHCLEGGFITRKFWLSYPNHLSYFNKESMTNLLTDLQFTLRAVVADNPIDLNLLNDNSNYIEDPAKGKKTHCFCVRVDNFLASIDRAKLLRVYEALGAMGVGRNLTYYCSLA